MTPNALLAATAMLGACSRTTAFVGTIGTIARKAGWQTRSSLAARHSNSKRRQRHAGESLSVDSESSRRSRKRTPFLTWHFFWQRAKDTAVMTAVCLAGYYCTLVLCMFFFESQCTKSSYSRCAGQQRTATRTHSITNTPCTTWRHRGPMQGSTA